jgi:two-component system, chemotaxis family, protein-glutamate methylesterase/glutaminase
MGTRDIVVIGGSAGSVEALTQLARDLPERFAGSIFVTVHFPAHATSNLPRILTRAGRLTALHAADDEPVIPGRIYVAPPDHHLLLGRRAMRIVRGPRENGNRPAADPMFRSAALAFGPRVIGVVLTGNLDDGTSGLRAIKRAGGVAIAQDPADAMFPSMPKSAIEHADVDRVVPVAALAATLGELMVEPIRATAESDMTDDEKEIELSAIDLDAIEQYSDQPGHVSAYSCPDCGGVLREIHDGDFLRYRCRVGHAWTGHALVEAQSEHMDAALWMALRSLEENVALAREIAARQRSRGHASIATRFDARAVAIEAKAAVIREALTGPRGTDGMDGSPGGIDAAPTANEQAHAAP